MTYGIINPSDEQKEAWQRHSWQHLCSTNTGFEQLFSGRQHQRLQQYATFSDQATAMLGSLNDLDRKKVIEEIIEITRNPSPSTMKRHWRNPFNRFIKSRYPFGKYHFFINYLLEADSTIAVLEVFFNRNLTGIKAPSKNERPMMYNVNRLNGSKYERPISISESDSLKEAWSVGNPTHRILTQYAAVNGMQNNLGKAGWLMGVHLDNAYRNANMEDYTLFHNPTEGGVIDLVECLWDKSPLSSHNAMYLSAALRQRQQSGQKTEWVVHSQGAIIFTAAVAHHNCHFGTPLDRHSVAIHAPGAHLGTMRRALEKAKMPIQRVRQNPFDLVPNIAGGNNLQVSGLKRSLKMMGLVFSENGGNLGISPHTLPYLGINTYQKQLEMAGFNKEAERVQTYIEKRNHKRQKRRGW